MADTIRSATRFNDTARRHKVTNKHGNAPQKGTTELDQKHGLEQGRQSNN